MQRRQPAVPVVEPVRGRGGEQGQHRAGRASAAAVTGRAAEALAGAVPAPQPLRHARLRTVQGRRCHHAGPRASSTRATYRSSPQWRPWLVHAHPGSTMGPPLQVHLHRRRRRELERRKSWDIGDFYLFFCLFGQTGTRVLLSTVLCIYYLKHL